MSDNEDYRIIDIIVDYYKPTIDRDRAACLIHLYIWFRKRFGVTLSKGIVLQILSHDNPVIANKYMRNDLLLEIDEEIDAFDAIVTVLYEVNQYHENM